MKNFCSFGVRLYCSFENVFLCAVPRRQRRDAAAGEEQRCIYPSDGYGWQGNSFMFLQHWSWHWGSTALRSIASRAPLCHPPARSSLPLWGFCVPRVGRKDGNATFASHKTRRCRPRTPRVYSLQRSQQWSSRLQWATTTLQVCRYQAVRLSLVRRRSPARRRPATRVATNRLLWFPDSFFVFQPMSARALQHPPEPPFSPSFLQPPTSSPEPSDRCYNHWQSILFLLGVHIQWRAAQEPCASVLHYIDQAKWGIGLGIRCINGDKYSSQWRCVFRMLL